MSTDTTATDRTRHVGRGIVVGVLIVLGSLLALLSVLAIWLNTVVFDTPTWRSTSAELIQNPAMQTQVANYVVNQVYNSSTVEQRVAKRLPPRLSPFAPAITSGLHTLAIDATERLLATPRVQGVWVDATTRAHDQFVDLITNKSKFTKIDNGEVVLDLHPVVVEVADQVGLGSAAAGLIPSNAGDVDIMDSNQLSLVQTGASLLHTVALVLPFVAAIVFILAVWLASGFRRRAMLWSAIGILVTTLILIFIRRVLGEQIIDALTNNVAIRPALINAWYIGTEVMATMVETLLIIAIVLIIGFWLSGTGRWSRAARGRLAPWLAKPIYAFGVPAVLLVILIAWAPLPIFQKLLPVIIIAVLGALGIEALRRLTHAEHPQTPAA